MKLSDITGSVTFPPGASDHKDCDYTVAMRSPAQHLVLTIGHTFGHPGWAFTHPQVMASHVRVMSFRRYLPSGSKRWIEKAGMERTFVIPLDRIELDLPTSGHSFVGVRINGVLVKLNVSGGTTPTGWQDMIGPTCATLVNYPKRIVRAVAQAAYTADECRAHGITTDATSEGALTRRRIAELMAEQLGVHGITPGATVFFASSTHSGGKTLESGIFTGMSGRRTRRMLVRVGENPLHAKSSHMDWHRTLVMNGRMPSVPDDFNQRASPLALDPAA